MITWQFLPFAFAVNANLNLSIVENCRPRLVAWIRETRVARRLSSALVTLDYPRVRYFGTSLTGGSILVV